MKISGERELELLKKIGFTRVAGSEEEQKAAVLLQQECEKLGVSAEIEKFSIEDAVIERAEFQILEPFEKSYEVTGYKCAQNTFDRGVTVDFLYAENALEADLADARGKIVMVNGPLRLPLFRRLIDAGAAGIVTMEGDFRDKPEETDLSTRMLRRTLRAFGNVPIVHMRVKDAMELVAGGARRAKLVLKNTPLERTSRNVIATIPGTERSEEIISFGAHYDSVPYSTGVYDNGAGTVINLEVLRYFAENPPKRTVKFIWYGSEEIGLEGSWAYVKAHQEELKKHLLMINVDVGGPVLGADKASVTGVKELSEYMDYFMKIRGHRLKVSQGIISSDSIPFAASGVPAVNFDRDGAPGAACIHNRFDTLAFLSAAALEKTTKHVLDFGMEMVNAAVFPVKREIPENIVEEIDRYLYKKELSQIRSKE